jgi:RNA polymerase sigma-70 factor (sigma-E family)
VGASEEAGAAYVVAEYPRLLRSAYLLTTNRSAAEDLAQETVVRVLANWGKVARADDPHAYVRRVMLNLFLRASGRAWHGEVPTDELPQPGVDGGFDRVDARDALRRGLAALPPRQRAAVVLRQYEQLTEAQTAAVLGCSVGNVKALASRGIAALRIRMNDAVGEPS